MALVVSIFSWGTIGDDANCSLIFRLIPHSNFCIIWNLENFSFQNFVRTSPQLMTPETLCHLRYSLKIETTGLYPSKGWFLGPGRFWELVFKVFQVTMKQVYAWTHVCKCLVLTICQIMSNLYFIHHYELKSHLVPVVQVLLISSSQASSCRFLLFFLEFSWLFLYFSLLNLLVEVLEYRNVLYFKWFLVHTFMSKKNPAANWAICF